MNMRADVQDDLLKALQMSDINKPVRYIYDQWFKEINALLIMKGASPDDAADIFQEAVIVLVDKVKSGEYRGDSSLKTFLAGIAKNLWMFELRTRQRREKREQAYQSMEDVQTETRHFEKDTFGLLNDIMSQIGETCQKILTGFYYQKKSMRELLQEFDYENEQVLRNKKAKCMKSLRDQIEKNPSVLHELKPLTIYAH
ncbi:MAG TPA: sigma-70 family RNA polymerase sigma factor [Chitinophagaceae bacterium]|nr:sigma-70 family RNA polymerase sigma factor [Chitinophagaceae bacterium]